MKLRRTADQVRMIGWMNLALTLTVAGFYVSEGLSLLLPAGVWIAVIMALAYAAASRIDRRAESVVGR
jgi:hypothetical protein